MSRAALTALQENHAFDPAPRLDEMYRYHVPFDDLVGYQACEHTISAAVRRGEQLAIVGDSGSGKSSVIAHVLGPLVEGLAPLPVPVALERPHVATDPIEFAGHVVRTVARYVELAHPAAAERAQEHVREALPSTPEARHKRRAGGALNWLAMRLELAHELESVVQSVPRTASEVFEHAQSILDLIRAHDLTPVLVFDDTDKWFASAFPERNDMLDGFFGRIVRVLAENLSAPTVLAVHSGYLHYPAYTLAQGFIETSVTLPRLPDVAGLRSLLDQRVVEHGVEPAGLITDEALGVLFEHYARGRTSDIRRRVLFVAHTALAHACDEEADCIERPHLEVALTETSG